MTVNGKLVSIEDFISKLKFAIWKLNVCDDFPLFANDFCFNSDYKTGKLDFKFKILLCSNLQGI